MEEYKGLEFITDKGTKCMVVEENWNKSYIIVNMDDYQTMARCGYDNIKELINTVKNNY
jgi:hypothetical protein